MRTDVVIIGGGVIGSAIAYYLTKRGKKVILLEKKYLVNGSSGACDQGILLQSKAPNEHLVLGIYSLESLRSWNRSWDENWSLYKRDTWF